MTWIEQTRNEEYIMGVDEVGRGPLFGGVAAAALIMPKNIFIMGINDSKKLSEKKRNLFFNEIWKRSLAIGLGYMDEKVIDKVNILEATKMAMDQAIKNASKILKPDLIIVDSVKLSGYDNLISIDHGDVISYNVAAASIVAKVSRDNLCYGWDKIYPGYDLKNNKGYGTKKHYLGLDQEGISDLHRRSFLKNMKTDNKVVGNLGEDMACKYLQEKNYYILERNYRNRLGEIDIIAMDRGVLVFVEVKARKNRRFGVPQEAVNDIKRHKIDKTANLFVAEKNWYKLRRRYDIIEIIFDEDYINHIENAFQISEF